MGCPPKVWKIPVLHVLGGQHAAQVRWITDKRPWPTNGAVGVVAGPAMQRIESRIPSIYP